MSIKIGNNTIGKIYIGNNEISEVSIGNNDIYSGEEISPYLCFKALQSNSTISYSGLSKTTVYYSTDGENWTQWTISTPITLTNVDDKLYVKNTSTTLSTSSKSFKFVMTGLLEVSGTLLAMSNNGGTSNNYNFSSLFDECSALYSAKNLVFPTYTSGNNMFGNMFYGCTSLVEMPNLSNVNGTGSNSFSYMFRNCTSLAKPSQLRNGTSTGGYYGMFSGCTSLKVNNTGASGTLFYTPTLNQGEMFNSTGGSYTGSANSGVSYYYY